MKNNWAPAESIDGVRYELRNAVFSSFFHISMAEVKHDTRLAEFGRIHTKCFIEFGVLSGLFSPEEANAWLNALNDKSARVEVYEKYPIRPPA